MAKRTKAQKKRLLAAVEMKSKELYLEGLFSIKDTEAIERIVTRAYNRMK